MRAFADRHRLAVRAGLPEPEDMRPMHVVNIRFAALRLQIG